MTVLHTGSNQKYAEGWQKLFGEGKRTTKKTTRKPASTATAKKAARSSASAKKKASPRKSRGKT